MSKERRHQAGDSGKKDDDQNPLQIGAALQMTVLFQFVLFGVSFATQKFGDQGLAGSALLLGLADVDALTLSMSKATTSQAATVDAGLFALIVGVLTNTIVKLGLALTLGRGSYRTRACIGLAAMGAALGTALMLT